MTLRTPWADRREGFVLLAALWIVVGVAALGMTAVVAARAAASVARNRIDIVRAEWRAAGCVAVVRAEIAASLGGTDPTADGDPFVTWTRLDEVIRATNVLRSAACDISVVPAGRALDVNAAGAETLRELFVALGAQPGRADSLSDAVLDWRDADDLARPFGAERNWYRERHRRLPRNGPFAAGREIAQVRGLDVVPGLSRVLDSEPGRVSINHAPTAVLLALPGLGEEAARRILELRRRGVLVRSWEMLVDRVSTAARDSLLRYYDELMTEATLQPEAWIVTARARDGQPPVTAADEVRLVRAGHRAAVVRRRTWLQ